MAPDPMTTPWGEHFELSTHLIAVELIRRGAELHWFRQAFFTATIGGRPLAVNQTRTNLNAATACEISGRKDYTRRMLRRAGASVAAGGTCHSTDIETALRRARKIGWPVIVKPVGGAKGRGVLVVDDEDQLATALRVSSGRVVVEARFVGDEARFLVVAGRTVAVSGRIPAHVIGDGRSTVAELVAAKNTARGQNPHLAGHLVPTGPNPDLVPTIGQRVVLDHRGGYSSGADSVDLTDTVHPSYRQIAERAYAAIPHLGLAGIDIIATDWSQPAAPDNHIVVEVNSRPAIGAHHFPWEGKPRDVAAAIVDACLGVEDDWDEGGTDGDDPDGWWQELEDHAR